MRRGLVSLFVLAACVRPAPRGLVPVPGRDAPVAGCRGHGNELRIEASIDDAPLVVLSEIRLHGEPLPEPTIAIWPDGRVVFARDGDRGLFEAQLAPARAAAIARDVFALLADERPYRDLYKFHVSGGQITTITARDGDRWRSTAVYGAVHDDFLGVKRPVPPERRSPPGPASPDGIAHPYGPSIDDLRAPPPPRLAAAYRSLLASRPSRGEVFSPHDYALIFWGLAPNTTYGPELAWPRDLPAPPRDLDPRRCDPYQSDGCAYALGPAYRDRVRALRHAIKRARRPVVVNAHRFWLEIVPRYRGEPTIDAVAACRNTLDRGQGQARYERP